MSKLRTNTIENSDALGDVKVNRNTTDGDLITLQKDEATVASLGVDAGALTVDVNASERLRVDTTGNLLVGKTTENFNTVGAQLLSTGRVYAIASSTAPMYANRKTSDGSIIDIAKDGTTVGSIGNVGGDITIGNDTTALRFYDGANEDGGNGILVPWRLDTNVARDSQINIGSSTERFRNLYLSGGVYVGGTGSANYLDDYEEGAWTPVVEGSTAAGSGSYTTQRGQYIKVGSKVFAFVRITWSGHTGTGALLVTGLPFTSVNTSSYTPVGSLLIQNVAITGTPVDGVCSYVPADRTRFEFYGSQSAAAASVINMSAAGEIIASITYQAA